MFVVLHAEGADVPLGRIFGRIFSADFLTAARSWSILDYSARRTAALDNWTDRFPDRFALDQAQAAFQLPHGRHHATKALSGSRSLVCGIAVWPRLRRHSSRPLLLLLFPSDRSRSTAICSAARNWKSSGVGAKPWPIMKRACGNSPRRPRWRSVSSWPGCTTTWAAATPTAALPSTSRGCRRKRPWNSTCKCC